MNVSIISWTEETKCCIQRLSDEFRVKSVAEKYFQYFGVSDNTFRICSIDAAINAYRMNEIDKFIIPCILKGNVFNTMYLLLKKYNIVDSDILYIPYNVITGTGEISISDLVTFIERTELDRLELHINDHCNLRCKNCSMLAGLVREETNADFEKTKLSLLKLKKIFPFILEIDIFGGEPLLNPQLQEYCEYIRLLYPETYIFIVTNGTKILTMNDSLTECLKKNQIRFSITYYPGFDNLIYNVMQFCVNKDIKFEILKGRANFLRLYDFSGNQEPTEVFNFCKRKLSIIAMRENKLAPCYTPFALKYAEKEFQIGYYEDGIIDLLTSELTPREIISHFIQPMDYCRFCHCDKTDWRQVDLHNGKINLQDWSR